MTPERAASLYQFHEAAVQKEIGLFCQYHRYSMKADQFELEVCEYSQEDQAQLLKTKKWIIEELVTRKYEARHNVKLRALREKATGVKKSWISKLWSLKTKPAPQQARLDLKQLAVQHKKRVIYLLEHDISAEELLHGDLVELHDALIALETLAVMCQNRILYRPQVDENDDRVLVVEV